MVRLPRTTREQRVVAAFGLAAAVACAVVLVTLGGAGRAAGPPRRAVPAAGGRDAAASPAASSAAHRRPAGRRGAAPRAPRTATPDGSSRPLAGKVVGIDPGHDGGNWTHPAAISRIIWNGRNYETCDTTGTETDSGYTEAQFTWNVARYLTADLEREGAKVVLTRHSNTGVGPCVTTRARILDRAHADVAIDIHGDGGPPNGRGFSILEPVPDGPNDAVIGTSDQFALDVRAAFSRYTGMPVSDYYGVDGLQPRDDLAGLNLTTVPKVLIECGNMRNSTDAALMVTPGFQRRAAYALAVAITAFLTHQG
jgi:N-acetylmuramoyl-L-alanine amidase